MQGIVIKQSQGLWSLETSSGVRWAGASLESVVEKAAATVHGFPSYEAVALLEALFARIPDSGGSQIATGVAGA
jgi:hypothetical protein